MAVYLNRMYVNGNIDEDMEGMCVLDVNQSKLTIEHYDDYKPLAQKRYFKTPINNDTSTNTFVGGMVFYNEDSKEINRTLVSFGQQLIDIRDTCKSQVVIVGDGISQMHSSTLEYLRKLYCNSMEDEALWDNMIDDLKDSYRRTYIIQRTDVIDESEICCVKVGEYQYPLTLLLKSENRRKHNSQEWILNSFASQCFTKYSDDFRNHYILMTDCGTLFGDKCIYRLLKYMISHPLCVGSTARQRVMTAKEQNMDDESWFSTAKYFRIIQLADYEVSYATYTGAFSAVGCLPVLPGPCALFRYSGLLSKRKILDIESGNETALEHYNNLVDISIDDTNICIENVKLAEDRIPSYSIVTHGEKGAYTTWVDGTVFKFQAETTLKSFILQRRRWINGAFSCYLWNCVVHPGLIIRSRHSIFRKFMILLLYWLQLLNYIFAMGTYGVMSGSLYISLLSLFDINSKISLLITLIYGFIVINHLIVHKFHVFSRLLTVIVSFVNAIVLVLIVSGFVYEIVKWGGLVFTDIGRTMIVCSALTIISIPFVMTLISLDIKSFGYLLLTLIPYWLFLPTLVGTFVMYSISRFSDITWGNRISKSSSSFNDATPEQISVLKRKMNNMAGLMLFGVILYNIGICSVLIVLYTDPLVVGIIMACIVCVFVIQCIISIVYFIGKHVSCGTCIQRVD